MRNLKELLDMEIHLVLVFNVGPEECLLTKHLSFTKSYCINFWQSWILRISLMHMTCFSILLTIKTQQIYKHALCWLEFTVDWKLTPYMITCDFEVALQDAINSTFPGVVPNGCLFHWKGVICRKIHKEIYFWSVWVWKNKTSRNKNGLERYNHVLSSKFKGKQSFLSLIKVLESETRYQVAWYRA